MATPEPEFCSCAALRQATRHVTQFYDAALAPSGLGLNQYSILSRLSRFGPMTIQKLAALLVMDRSTLGHLLRPLEARDLLTLQTSQEDRRSRIVSLTQVGTDLFAKARPLWVDAERHFESRFGAEAAHALRATLKQVTQTDLTIR
ncbi:MarR family winged helix-turn-helix transcriptional regulator [Beijerinckia sp. L45]|uniref:MarR family winged helix-turn-helix transcriptional regulator n=1 Tax=Beijerinckia sp. L45 TaxID=1641855 RepID=UPI00131EC231|nr:MarR family transcriptional regulator [Beijerinckia sp. L45]